MESTFQHFDISERYSSALRRQRSSERDNKPPQQEMSWVEKAKEKTLQSSLVSFFSFTAIAIALIGAIGGGIWLWRQASMKAPMEFE